MGFSFHPGLEFIQINIDDGGNVESYELGEKQASNYRQSQRTTGFGARSPTDSDGQGSQKGAHRGHHNGAETDQAALVDRFGRVFASFRSASRAKSIIMMAFFLTNPISMITPTNP